MKQATPSQRVELEKIRRIVKELVPDAEEVISYGVPTFKLNKRPLIYYAAYKNHMSIHPASDAMIVAISEKLGKFRTGKGTFQFTEANPIPEPMMKKIVLFRLADILKS